MGFFKAVGSILGSMAGPVTGGIAGAVGGLIDSSMDRRAARGAVDAQNNASAVAAAQNRDWEKMMSDTSMQRRVSDLQAAGLNPMLAYSLGGAAVPGGSVAQVTGADTITNSAFSSQRVSNESSLVSAQVANLTSDTRNKDAQAAYINAQTENMRVDTAVKQSMIPLNQVGAEKSAAEISAIRQQITESIARVDQLVKQGKLTDAEAAKVRAEIPNLVMQRQVILSQARATSAAGIEHAASADEIRKRTELLGYDVPKAFNRSEAEQTWWKQKVSPYLDDILGIGGLGASAAGGFFGARAGR